MFLENLFLGFATVGGVLFVLRTAMLFLGWGGGDPADLGEVPDGGAVDVSDPDAAHSSGGDFRLFSLHGMTSFAFLFGLTGWLAMRDGSLGPGLSTLAALAVGFAAMFATAWIFRMTSRLQSDGTVSMADAVGASGVIYLGIRPGATGQVSVVARGQSKIFDARAKDPSEELPTGTPVTVVAAEEILVVQKR
ncbi:MAG: NfeD family protein [Kiritimatiellae bacterium]|nr:NfeD family protein [Kiritimatiellia bacterium]